MSSSSTETLVDVVMPQMGVSVSEGTIVEWRKQVGDWVEYEEAIVDISTDKIDTEVPSPAAGRVAEIVVEVGTTVEVGAVLARLATDAKPGQAHASEQNGAPPDERGRGGHRRDAGAGDRDAVARAGHGRRPTRRRARGARAAPGATRPWCQRIAAEHDVDLDQVQGTGRDGRVRKQDVLAYIESGRGAGGAAEPEPPLHIESPYRPEPRRAEAGRRAARRRRPPRPPRPAAAAGAYQPPAAAPLSRMRKLVGEHMKRSLDTAATCTTWIEADMSRVERGAARGRAHGAALRGPRDASTRCASTPRSTPGWRATSTPSTATSTSASRCRWARTA